ncbi:PepSY domain-containing protein [Aquabacterium sp.]|uniref:PepSY domain-containing protein n=1 Tax=Aquabacterium sp. TaxID=1872578 RepID=UPI003783DE47
MAEPTIDPARRAQLAAQATAFAERLGAAALGETVVAELLHQRLAWSQFRHQCQHHLRLLQRVTTVAVVLDADDPARVLGWLVDKRKNDSADRQLSDDQLIAKARALPQIGPDLPVMGLRAQPLDAKRSCSVLRFGEVADALTQRDVWLNHTSGEVICVLPLPQGTPTPLNLGPGASAQEAALREAGLAQAWQLLESALAPRADAEAMALLREIFQFRPGDAVRDGAGRAVLQFPLWRQYSTVDVSLAPHDGHLQSWYCEALQADAPQQRISAAQATQLAQPHLQPGPGLAGPQVTFGDIGGEQKATVHWWHMEGGFNIEGDQATVLLNASTGAVFSMSRKWRPIDPALLAPPRISEAQALAAAAAAHGQASDGPGRIIGRSVIELADEEREPPAVRDVPVWRVGYREAGGMGFTELAVDCRSGEVVRVTGW